jgi:hypothetical protein
MGAVHLSGGTWKLGLLGFVGIGYVVQRSAAIFGVSFRQACHKPLRSLWLCGRNDETAKYACDTLTAIGTPGSRSLHAHKPLARSTLLGQALLLRSDVSRRVSVAIAFPNRRFPKSSIVDEVIVD